VNNTCGELLVQTAAPRGSVALQRKIFDRIKTNTIYCNAVNINNCALQEEVRR